MAGDNKTPRLRALKSGYERIALILGENEYDFTPWKSRPTAVCKDDALRFKAGAAVQA